MSNWVLAGIAAVIWGGSYWFYFRGYHAGFWRVREDLDRLAIFLRLRSGRVKSRRPPRTKRPDDRP